MKASLIILALAAMVTAVAMQWVKYDRRMGSCTQVTRSGQRDCRWVAGLYPYVDQLVLGGTVVAYKIKWFGNGKYSNWYVPGVNDIDWKYNPGARRCGLPYTRNSLRRVWAYFTSHVHTYIICKNK